MQKLLYVLNATQADDLSRWTLKETSRILLEYWWWAIGRQQGFNFKYYVSLGDIFKPCKTNQVPWSEILVKPYDVKFLWIIRSQMALLASPDGTKLAHKRWTWDLWLTLHLSLWTTFAASQIRESKRDCKVLNCHTFEGNHKFWHKGTRSQPWKLTESR